jgi:AhpD family alkylhydroperoxidase
MSSTELTARTSSHPIFTVPGAMEGLQALDRAMRSTGISPLTLELVNLRASQINACGVCAVQHPKLARELGETDERLWAVVAWRDAPFFDDAERAALALTEAVTRLSDRSDPVPDEVWDAAARHFDAAALSSLVITIAATNAWNRINAATRQVAGSMAG